MRTVRDRISEMARTLWLRLREWCGDAAYERYRRAALRKKAADFVSPEQFYIEQLERRYSRPNRCC